MRANPPGREPKLLGERVFALTAAVVWVLALWYVDDHYVRPKVEAVWLAPSLGADPFTVLLGEFPGATLLRRVKVGVSTQAEVQNLMAPARARYSCPAPGIRDAALGRDLRVPV